MPSQVVEQGCGADTLFSPSLVVYHACSSTVDLLEGVDVFLQVRVPDTCAVLKLGTNEGGIGQSPGHSWAVMEVAGDEVQRGVGFLGDCAYLVMPLEVV